MNKKSNINHVFKNRPSNGNWGEDSNIIMDLVVNFLKNSLNNNRRNYNLFNPNIIPSLIGMYDNVMLSKMPIENEIREVFADMNS